MYLLFILFFFSTLIFMIISQSVLIRFEDLETFYEKDYMGSFSNEDSDTGIEYESSYNITVGELCSRIIDSSFFKTRHQVYLDLTYKNHIYTVKKYYKKFLKINVKTGNRFENRNVMIEDEVKKERVLPCLIQNLRSNKLEQILISREYSLNTHYIFIYDQNHNLKLLAFVEDIAGTSVHNNFQVMNFVHNIAGIRKCYDILDEEKLRLCNLVINSGRIFNPDFIFMPHKTNVRSACLDSRTLFYLPTKPNFARSLVKIMAFGCRALDIFKNKYTIVYITDYWTSRRLPSNVTKLVRIDGRVERLVYEKDRGLIFRVPTISGIFLAKENESETDNAA